MLFGRSRGEGNREVKAFVVSRNGLTEDGSPVGRLLERDLEVVDTPKAAEVILVLGGDGTMLKAIRQYREHRVPFYGLNFGHIGFLMNEATEEAIVEIGGGLVDLLELKLLSADLYDGGGQIRRELAFNDFYFERASTQTARVRILVDGKMRLDELTCDGVIVSTPAGSTAYNAAAEGIILPIDSNSIVVTGICPALFHHWRTAQLSDRSVVTLEALEADRRPVRFLADGIEIARVTKATIHCADESITLGFARSQDFREKIADLQFGGHEEVR